MKEQTTGKLRSPNYKHILMLLLLLNATFSKAQQNQPLNIGDMVPKFSYSKVVKGDVVTALEGDKVYLLEFWATWCKPCIAAMPHLSEIAEKYPEKLRVIAVNAFEFNRGKPYEEMYQTVRTFVEGHSAEMKFDVVMDNNDLDMQKWLKKADIIGIPATFLVKDNKILWIGRPTELDGAIAQILDGTYQIEKARNERIRELENDPERIQRRRNEKVDSLLKAGSYDAAVEDIDRNIAENPRLEQSLMFRKIKILFEHSPKERTIGYLTELANKKPQYGIMIAGYLAKQNGLANEIYRSAIDIYLHDNTESPINLENLAVLYAKVGDNGNAVSAIEKAMVILEKKIPSTQDPANLNKTIADYKERAAKYRQLAGQH